MDIRKSVENEKNGWQLPAWWLIIASGFITGSVIFCRSFTDADVAAYIDSQRLIPDTFAEAFVCTLRTDALFLAVIIGLAFFAPGWLAVPLVLLYRGLGVGIGACCLIDSYGRQGALYTLTVLALPTVISMIAYAITCKNAARLSFGICRYFVGKNEPDNRFFRLIGDIPACTAVILLSSSLSALMRTVMHNALS